MTLGAGLVLTGCGDDETATTPAPAPPPPPPPAPEPEPEPDPEPEPEPEPTPFLVQFSVPDDAKAPFPMIPDMDDDEATAKANVNPQMMVSVNMPAIVRATFVEGAAPIGLIPGPNAPFLYVDWEAMQSQVVTAGVTFVLQAVEIGANQEPLPVGPTHLVTCGPFECAEGPAAPVLSIANSPMCTDWDPTVEFQVGKVDNDVIDPDAGQDAADGVNTNDGIDLGIVTSSSLKMTAKHIFSGVSGGTNSETPVEAASGSNKTHGMKAVSGVIRVDGDNLDTEDTETDYVVCDNTYATEDVSSKADRPAGCFRLIGPGAMGRDDAKGPDYLAGWSIELSPLGADVGWGNVDWETNPFEDLECGASEPIMVADHVDICDMFDTEVDMATGKGWKPEVVFDANNRVIMWAAGATASTGQEKMFKTVWFDDNLNGKIKKDTKASDQTARNTALTASGVDVAASPTTTNGIHDLYNQNDYDGNIQKIWELLTDSDGDLVASAGDLGKVDLLSDDDDPKTADNETTIVLEACESGVSWKGTTAAHIASGCGGTDGTDGAAAAEQTGQVKTNPDGNADNYVNAADSVLFSDFRGCSEDDGGDDADGSECDATWENEVEILFADGTFGCSTTRMITVTCEWDADGGMAQGRNALPDAADLDSAATNTDNNRANFIKCSAE